MMNRVQKEMKAEIYTENARRQGESMQNQQNAIDGKIAMESPHIFKEQKRRMEALNVCQEGLQNSYIKSPSKIFEKFMLWPFVPRMKMSESINASGRLCCLLSLLYIIYIFIPIAFPTLATVGAFAKIGFSSSIGIQLLVVFLLNFLLYIYHYFRMHMCINRESVFINSLEGDIKKKRHSFMGVLNERGKENFFTAKGYMGKLSKVREPLRGKNDSLGNHPSIFDIS